MLTRYSVQRIDSLAAGKVLAFLCLILGVMQGLVVSAMTVADGVPGFGSEGKDKLIAIILLIVIPFAATCMGFAAGVLGSVVYNASVGLTGGFELELKVNRGDDE